MSNDTLSGPADGKISDDFATIPDVPINAQSQRLTPQQMSTGTTRGTQTVAGNDGSKVTFGVIPDSPKSQLGVGQYDKIGNVVSRLGQQEDTSTGLKFFDENGVGVAQFGTFVDGPFALKVAQPGIEVGSALPTQLIFNSAQNIFKIVKTDVVTLPQMAVASPISSAAVTVDTGIISSTPLVVLGFILGAGSVGYTSLPFIREQSSPLDGDGGITYIVKIGSFLSVAGTVVVNVFGTSYDGGGVRGPFSVRYYVLQETAI